MKFLPTFLKDPGAWAVTSVALAVVVILMVFFRPEYLNTDSAQYIATARQLLREGTLSTNLIYYEQQSAGGVIPAAQTVWPPGFPVLISGAISLGVDAMHAPFYVALVSHFLTAILLYLLLRRLDCGQIISAGAAVAYSVVVLDSVLVIRGLSEASFTLMTVLSCFVICSPDGISLRRSTLVLGGVAAAAAFATRYAGIAFVAAYGAMLAVRWLTSRTAKTWWDAVLAMLVPVAVVMIMFLRNYLTVGSISGGPSVEFGTPLTDVVRGIVWAFGQLAGRYGASFPLLELTIGALFGLLVLGLIALRAKVVASLYARESTGSVVALSLAYVILTVAMCSYMAYRRLPDLVSARYFLPLVPFLIILAALLLRSLRHAVWKQPSRLAAVNAAGAALLILFVIGQARAVSTWRGWIVEDRKFSTIMGALEEPYDSMPLGDFIRHRLGKGALLDVDGQLVGMLLDVPAVGLPDRAFTQKIWTEDEVHRLVRKLDVRLVCIFPPVFDVNSPSNKHRELYLELYAGKIPPWLELVAETPSAKIYGVLPVP